MSPCLWPVDPACMSDEWAVLDESVKTRALTLASATLHRLTGARVTACPITIRPNAGTGGCFIPSEFGYTGIFRPGINLSGRWVNNCGPVCSNPRKQIRLPRPVGRIVEVKVDGVALYETDYVVSDGNLLIYRGTGAGFPVSQDVMVPPTQPGTMTVTYFNGYEPDALAAYAAGILTMEFAKACSGSKCRLPNNVTSIVRQGVAMEVATGSFPNGMTGIREVDSFIALWNPDNQRPSRIMIPGVSNASGERSFESPK